jgi:ABC-type transport system involved in multi-copper enzyme maturation permease subunit
MKDSIVNSVGGFLSLSWLTGPIFDKELRVSSRRRRNYILRSAYLFLLIFFVAYIWFVSVMMVGGTSAIMRVSRMSTAGIAMVTTIAWFQFIALQFIAMAMLSNSINLEVQRKTLDALIATPITSLQIVMGKLCSKLLQLLLLLALSLPLLAVVRGFGGVQWGYLIAALCITLTATIFAASVSLFLSTVRKQAYSVIAGAFGLMVLLYGGLPAIISLLSFLTGYPVFDQVLMPAVLTINPFVTLARLTASMLRAGGGVSWPLHCSLMMTMSIVLLALSVLRLRPAIMARDQKPLARRLGRRWAKSAKRKTSNRAQAPEAPLTLQITGDPVIWRELRRPVKGSMVSEKIEHIIFAAALIVMYGVALYYGWIGVKVFHCVFVGLMSLIILMRTAGFAATSISSEKQAKAWPILLTTPLEDWEIVRSKAIAIARRTMLLWIVLLVHILLFTVFMVLHPLAIVGAIYSLVPAALLLIGVGLFAGTLFKSTTGAMVATYAVPLVAWFFCPCFSFGNPIFYAAMSMQIESGMFSDTIYSDMAGMAVLGIASVIMPGVGYTTVGILLIWWAKCRVRRKVFD